MSVGKVIETLETEIREYKRMIDERTLCLADESIYGEFQSRIDFDREIIALLRTHPDAQPNEPLRWRSCKKEKPTETWWYEVVQTRLSGAKARVTIAMYDPRYYDGDGWGYMNITQWRPLPDPPKEDAR